MREDFKRIDIKILFRLERVADIFLNLLDIINR